MPAPVVAGASFRAGIRSEVLATYQRQYAGIQAQLGGAMTFDVPSDKRSEFYFYYESAPHIQRWIYGEAVPEKGFRGIQYEVINRRWGEAITWQADDEADDQTRSLVSHAQGLGQSAAFLDERVFFQIIREDTADVALLPSIPNAPDGNAIWFATRFGATSGNLMTGTGVATAAAVRTDYWAIREQFKLFQDTEGQPLFDSSVTDGPALVIYGAANEEVFAEAFLREIIQGTSAGISDEIRASGKTPVLLSTQRITDNDWWAFMSNARIKAVMGQTRESIREDRATEANSDIARKFDERSIRFKMRKGYGINLPTGGIKNNN